MLYRWIILFIFFSSQINICAQSNYILKIYESKTSIKSIEPKLRVLNLKDAKKQALIDLNQYRIKGYFTASLDSITSIRNFYTAHIHLGKWFEINHIKFEGFDSSIVDKKTKKILNPKSIDNSEDYKKWAFEVLSYAENIGYPFAQITFKNITTDGNKISCIAQMDKGELYTFDTIHLIGDNILTQKFLYQYLDIAPEQTYNEELFKEVKAKLLALPFIQLKDNPMILFTTNKAILTLNFKKRSIDLADGIVGFAPKNDVSTGVSKMMLTGQLDLKLNNLLKSAKSLEIHWKSFQPSSQQLKASFKIPFLFKTKIGLGAAFDLIKQSEDFLTTKLSLDPFAMLNGTNTFTLKYIRRNTIAINIDTSFVKNSKRLPTNSPFKSTAYGLGLNLNQTDDIINPKRGYSLSLNSEVELKKLKKNTTISNILLTNSLGESYNAYDSAELSNIQYRYNYSFNYYLPIFKSTILAFSLNGSRIFAPKIYQSELSRLGGINSLRGFDDNSIFTSAYDLINVEYRYLLKSESFLSLFLNTARVENNSYLNQQAVDFPIGFGFGSGLRTKNGLLNISLAMGKNKNNQLDLSRTKVHFGFINYF